MLSPGSSKFEGKLHGYQNRTQNTYLQAMYHCNKEIDFSPFLD